MRWLACLSLFLLVLPLGVEPMQAEARETQRVREDKPSWLLTRLKRAVKSRDYAGEWATLSPGFKLRMNKRAGRTVDQGDYAAFRTSNRRDREVRQVERYLQGARLHSVRYIRGRPGYANAAIHFGGPLFFGKSIRIRIVKHALWRLEVAGEPEPFWGFVGDKRMPLTENADGSKTIQMLNDKGKVIWNQTFPKEQITRYFTFTKWFFDHFGAAEERFFGG